MDNETKSEGQSGGINISGSTVSAGGDMVGRDKITYGDAALAQALAQWRDAMNAKIDAHPSMSAADKQDAKDQVGKIQEEAAKAPHVDPSRLEKLINTLAVMAPDIFDVAVATLVNPLAGIGLALHKIGDRAQLERTSAAPSV